MCLTILTNSLRRSSVSGGKLRRMIDAVVGRADAQVAVADGLLDRAKRAAIVRLDDQLPGLGHLEAGQLLHRHHRAVVVDHQLLDQRRRCPTGAHRRELALYVLDCLLHLVDGVEEGLFGHSAQRIQPRAGRRHMAVSRGRSCRRVRRAGSPAERRATTCRTRRSGCGCRGRTRLPWHPSP